MFLFCNSCRGRVLLVRLQAIAIRGADLPLDTRLGDMLEFMTRESWM